MEHIQLQVREMVPQLISYLSQYRFKSITVTGGKDVGGLFGALKNTSTISATVTVSGKTTSAITTNVNQ